MDDKELQQGNNEQNDIDERVKPFLEEKAHTSGKSRTGRLALGIVLIVAGCLMGLVYLGSVCFVRTTTSTVAVEHVAFEHVAVATAVPEAVQNEVIVTEYYYPEVVEERFVETSKGVDREIYLGSAVFFINATVTDVDISVAFSDTDGGKLIISNDHDNKVNIELNDKTLNIYESSKNSKAEISITLPYIEGITVNSTSGDLDITGADYIRPDYIVYTTKSGDCDLDSINSASVVLNSKSGEFEINNSSISSLSLISSSGDVEIFDCDTDDLVIRTTSGDVEVSSLRCYGNAEIATTSGDTVLEQLFVQTLTCNSSSGDLKLNDSEINVFSTSSSSGNRKISNSYCLEVYSTTSSGNFVTEVLTAQTLNIRSSSGKANIYLMPIEDINVSISTSSGNVNLKLVEDISVNLICDKISKNEMQLDSLSNNIVNIQTNSGTVNLTR